MDIIDTLFGLAVGYVLVTGVMYIFRKEFSYKQRNPPQEIRYSGRPAVYLGTAHLTGGLFLGASLIPDYFLLMFPGIVIIIGTYIIITRRYEGEIIKQAVPESEAE